jgi:assimilatory nitrate reductase catalytic subunit
VAEALARCPFVVVSDVVASTDTSRYAHVLLPAAAWGEKDGTVTNSERRISRQRPLRSLPGEVRPDWWALAEVAKRMGFGNAFAYEGPAAIFREHAALSGTENDGARDFDIGALADLPDEAYRTMRPVQWPVPRASRSRAARPGGRFFGDGRFFTPDRRARFVPTPAAPPAPVDPAYPLTLNTGRIRDQWHTMTRTGRSARLSAHLAEPFVEIHPDDAKEAGIAAARLVEVETPHGRLVARALVTESQRRGAVFVPIHWTGQQASLARVDALVTAATDPVSGQPALKSARARIRPYAASWYSFAVLAERPDPVPADYWAIATAIGGWRVEMAGLAPPPDWAAWAAGLLRSGEGSEILSYLDTAAGHHRFVAFAGERLIGAVFVAPEPVQVARTFAADGLSALHPSLAERLQFLAGRPGGDRPDPGPIVCSCFSVGANDIVRAIVNDNCRTVEAVGSALRAGTNCGSCRSEIQKMLRQRGAA